MSKKRRQHSAALKAQVGLEALKEIQPVHVIAAKHQVQTSAGGAIRIRSGGLFEDGHA